MQIDICRLATSCSNNICAHFFGLKFAADIVLSITHLPSCVGVWEPYIGVLEPGVWDPYIGVCEPYIGVLECVDPPRVGALKHRGILYITHCCLICIG